jgi:hypothetical protein
MIIDCHGHYTIALKALGVWRNQQIAGLTDPGDEATREGRQSPHSFPARSF